MSDPGTDAPSRLARRLGLGDAVVIGLGSMIGAGVFVVFGPAADVAGSGLLLGLAIAACVAFCNALSSAQLAAVYPASGGTYVYGRERLGVWWGYLAGWGFVVGKTASCAAMALAAGAYAAPAHSKPVAIAVVVGATAVNYRGIHKTAAVTRVIVVIVLSTLALVVLASLVRGDAHGAELGNLTSGGIHGILQSAGLMFFAFAGYARIATLGEEVREPATTIPRAIVLALAITLVVYVVVAVSMLTAVGPVALAASPSPLATAVRASTLDGLVPLVRVGGTVAAVGVLLSLVAGVSRTTFAMAADRELPGWLAAVHPTYQVPHRAELVVGAIITVVVAVSDVRGVIGFSSFCVLGYYAVANASAWTLRRQERRWPRAVAGLGLVGCAVLAFTLPFASITTGLTVLSIGAVVRAAR